VRFLSTVLDGFSMAEDSILQPETETLHAAVDCVLSGNHHE